MLLRSHRKYERTKRPIVCISSIRLVLLLSMVYYDDKYNDNQSNQDWNQCMAGWAKVLFPARQVDRAIWAKR